MIKKRCWLCAYKLKDGYCQNKECPESIRAKIDKAVEAKEEK